MSGSRDERHAARLAAVQALYQMELGETGLDAVIAEFEEHRFAEEGAEGVPAADRAHFARILRGVVEHQRDIDPGVDAVLRQGWPLARLDATVRAALRAGAFELLVCRDIPPKVVINEYVELAKDFFSGDEPAFINGVLDSLARQWRDEG